MCLISNTRREVKLSSINMGNDYSTDSDELNDSNIKRCDLATHNESPDRLKISMDMSQLNVYLTDNNYYKSNSLCPDEGIERPLDNEKKESNTMPQPVVAAPIAGPIVAGPETKGMINLLEKVKYNAFTAVNKADVDTLVLESEILDEVGTFPFWCTKSDAEAFDDLIYFVASRDFQIVILEHEIKNTCGVNFREGTFTIYVIRILPVNKIVPKK